MSEQNGDPGTPQNPAGENPLNPQAAQPDVQRQLGELAGQKKHFQEKSEKLERELFTAQEKLSAQTPAPSRNLDAREFAKLLNKGYSDEDITFLEIVMKSTNKSADEAMELPHVKKAIEATRAERQSQAATPEPSRPVSLGGLGRSGANPTSFFDGQGKPTNPIPDEKKLSFQEWKTKRRTGN